MTVDVACVAVVDVDPDVVCMSEDVVLGDVVMLDGVGVADKACGFAKASLLRLFPFTRFLPVISLRT